MQTGYLVLSDDEESWIFINNNEKRGLWPDINIKSEAFNELGADGWIYQWSHPNKEEHHFHKYI